MTFFGDRYTREFFLGGLIDSANPTNKLEFKLQLINPHHMQIYNDVNNPKELRDAPIIISIDDDNPGELEYEDKNEKIDKRAGKEYEALLKYSFWVHKGQRKLFISEVQFLSRNLTSNKDKAIFVYIGAAPSCKGWLFHLMFPNAKLLFIDPNDFLIKIDGRTPWEKRPDLGIVYLSGPSDKGINRFDGNKEVFSKVPMVEDPLDNQENYEKYAKFIMESDNYIFINQQYASIDTAKFVSYLFEQYSPEYKTFLCSDLRTNTQTGRSPGEVDIAHDMLLNFLLLHISKPDHSMVKLRGMYNPILPGDLEKLQPSLDEVKSITGKDFGEAFLRASIAFYEGEIYVQAWRGRYSSECRLHISKNAILNNSIREYPKKKFENVNYYYNAITRTSMYFRNPMVGVVEGMDNCGDCAIEGKTWEDYMNISGSTIADIKRYSRMLDDVNDQRLVPSDKSWNKHGTLLYEP